MVKYEEKLLEGVNQRIEEQQLTRDRMAEAYSTGESKMETTDKAITTTQTPANDNKKVFEGKMMPFHENHGWYVQATPNARENDPGVRNCSALFQWAIGKKVRVTVEVIE